MVYACGEGANALHVFQLRPLPPHHLLLHKKLRMLYPSDASLCCHGKQAVKRVLLVRRIYSLSMTTTWCLFMAVQCNRAGQAIYIFILSFVMTALCNRGAIIFLPCSFFPSFFHLLSSFFPRLISAVGDWMSTILLHMAWP